MVQVTEGVLEMTGEWLEMPEGSLEITLESWALHQQRRVSLSVISTNEVRRNLNGVEGSNLQTHLSAYHRRGSLAISCFAGNGGFLGALEMTTVRL